MTERNYPDIQFVETDAEKILNSLIASYELITKRKLYPADPTRLFINWVADIYVQLSVGINESAKQNVFRFAKGDNLDSLAEIFRDEYRLGAESAKAVFRFYLSTTLASQCLIRKGTRITVDGEIIFETEEDLYVKAGELFGEVAAVCSVPGIIGNGFMPGQVAQLVDIFPFYERVENITKTDGGAEAEKDEAFYNRMRENVESFSTAGPEGAYIYFAKKASAKITDVDVDAAEDVVFVRILTDNGLPSAQILNDVTEALNDKKIRPMTEKVQVLPPGVAEFDIDLTYYISNPSASSGTTIVASVSAAIAEYEAWQTTKMGRDINPSYLISMLMKTGIKRVDLRSPVYTSVGKGTVAVIRSRNVLNGGAEDE